MEWKKGHLEGKIAPSLGDENLPWLLTTYPSLGMMLQECYKIQCIQVVGSCEEIAALLMDYEANHHPARRPHEDLSIGGQNTLRFPRYIGSDCVVVRCAPVFQAVVKSFFF